MSTTSGQTGTRQESGRPAGAPSGLFLTFEGTDGSGKTTQIRLLAKRLRDLGHDVVETVEPGGTSIGSQIRRILLDSANQEMAAVTELLLYFAARAQNVEQCIRPALAAGRIVISDRFTDSTLVYQGAGRGLGEEVVRQLHHVACGDLQPSLTLCLDLDVEGSLRRARERNARASGETDELRLDEESADFHHRVRDGYMRLAAAEPLRVRVIDASPPPEQVAEAVWAVVRDLLGSRRV